MSRVNTHQRWVVFCRVVDNHGDLGVCWRLSSQLAARGKTVRLYVDDASALAWMAPQGCRGVQVLPWPDAHTSLTQEAPADVVIESFGCEVPASFQAAMAAWAMPPVWINLEYFSAEGAALRNHGLPSPVMNGPAKGMTKWFFYPGLSEESGGVLDGPDNATNSAKCTSSVSSPATLNISLFCYEPASLDGWLRQLNHGPQDVCLSVTAGRATQAVQQTMSRWTDALLRLRVSELPYLSHEGFDAMLAAQDLNLVRGEDSLVRAIWAGKAFLWQIYPQTDGAHWPKLQAFLLATQAPAPVVQVHLAWNADQACPMPELSPELLQTWTIWAQDLRRRLKRQTDLLTRLESFVAAHG